MVSLGPGMRELVDAYKVVESAVRAAPVELSSALAYEASVKISFAARILRGMRLLARKEVDAPASRAREVERAGARGKGGSAELLPLAAKFWRASSTTFSTF